MKWILAKSNRKRLEQFVTCRTLMAFDFDGTLSPIVQDRRRARMRAITRSLLVELARLYPCIVISGRARDDAAGRLRGIGLRTVIGNHGIEPAIRAKRLKRLVRHWRTSLVGCLGVDDGFDIEDKTYSLSIHYSGVRDKHASRGAIAAAIAGIRTARVMGGKEVVNLVPRGKPDKGDALRRVCKQFGCARAVFVGDDITDEDVFVIRDPENLLTIRVGRNVKSHAAFYLSNQSEIDQLLSFLVRPRPQQNTRRAGSTRSPQSRLPRAARPSRTAGGRSIPSTAPRRPGSRRPGTSAGHPSA